jgi:hypothetical protein
MIATRFRLQSSPTGSQSQYQMAWLVRLTTHSLPLIQISTPRQQQLGRLQLLRTRLLHLGWVQRSDRSRGVLQVWMIAIHLLGPVVVDGVGKEGTGARVMVMSILFCPAQPAMGRQ